MLEDYCPAPVQGAEPMIQGVVSWCFEFMLGFLYNVKLRTAVVRHSALRRVQSPGFRTRCVECRT